MAPRRSSGERYQRVTTRGVYGGGKAVVESAAAAPPLGSASRRGVVNAAPADECSLARPKSHSLSIPSAVSNKLDILRSSFQEEKFVLLAKLVIIRLRLL